MANWMIQLSRRYFARFLDRLREELVKQAVIHADETVLQVLKEEERRLLWQKQAKPILDAYWAWVYSIRLPSGKLKDAVTYALNQKDHLCTFLDHGEVEISSNQVENAIRPFAVGRKGWLFSDTPEGAEASAVIYSLMESAKAKACGWRTISSTCCPSCQNALRLVRMRILMISCRGVMA